MPIYLVQHGKSLSKEEDSEQGLSEQGVKDTKRIAEVAAHYKIKVDKIVHSTKKRARQTAEIFNSVLLPSQGIQEVPGIKPMDDAARFAETIDDNKNLMIISHLPFLSTLVSLLILGKAAPAVFTFQNSGIVCLGKAPNLNSWIINWTLMPDIR